MTDKKVNKKDAMEPGAKISRRDFIKLTGAAVAGVSLPFYAPNAFSEAFDVDTSGALITAVKFDPLRSYAGDYEPNPDGAGAIIAEGVSDLLYAYIQSGETAEELWKKIVRRIDYTYESLDFALLPILGSLRTKKIPLSATENNFLEINSELTAAGRKIIREINGSRTTPGKKLLFKPNLVGPNVLNLFSGDGSTPRNQHGLPGEGLVACTDWCLLAALMRWFHDNLDITFHQMAIGEASPTARLFSMTADKILRPYLGFEITPEALFEGRITNPENGKALYYGGYPLYFLRKYLADTHDPSHEDDPMQGHLQGIFGPYIPPGQAQNQLLFYNMSLAETTGAAPRGREIQVPSGACYNEVVVHKALIGDPADLENYPGAVLINVPKLKIHGICLITHAVKNLGIGLWPLESGYDDDPDTPDYKYGWPSSTQSLPECNVYPAPNLKGGVQHSPRSKDVVLNCDGAVVPSSLPESLSDGIKGSMVDICLAVMAQKKLVPYMLHISDAIAAANVTHGGGDFGYLNNEGLILASEDPVALDLFAGRYLFKNVPCGTVEGHPFAIHTPCGNARFDSASNRIVSSSGGYEWPVENTRLFSYAERRGLGKQRYHVVGLDRTEESGCAVLVSRNGHFGKVLCEKGVTLDTWQEFARKKQFQFEEIISQPQYTAYGFPTHYWSIESGMHALQKTFFKLAKACDALTLANLNYKSGYEAHLNSLDEDGDSRFIFAEEGNDKDHLLGYASVGYSFMAAGQIERATAHLNAKRIKYSNAAWNELGVELNEGIALTTAHQMAIQPWVESQTDPFFNIPYGLNANGEVNWPSIQFAKYISELTALTTAYENAKSYADAKAYTFTLFVPKVLPYFTLASDPFTQIGPEVLSTDDPHLICTTRFYNEHGEEVEQW